MRPFDSMVLVLCFFLTGSNCFVIPASRPLAQTQQLPSYCSGGRRRVVTATTTTEQNAASESPAVPEAMAAPSRGKVNEIDFCIAPADVSLSRAYKSSFASTTSTTISSSSSSSSSTSINPNDPPILSLTRALNNASNRAVRRILLARAWPSAEALNKSFRQAARAEKEREEAMAAQEKEGASKCPIPRPILNLLVRRKAADKKYVSSGKSADDKSTNTAATTTTPSTRSRTDEEYVQDQLVAFRERYGNLPGYVYAEAYLESILSLATSGKESPRVKEVMESGIYDESYRRIVGVLRTVGAQFEGGEPATGSSRIAPILKNQDICLSMLDKINMRKEASAPPGSKNENGEDEGLGGLLLSAKEPTMTRELNALSNIVQRALLFGGDQELLVLFETLVADRPRFIQRWYPGTGGVNDEAELGDEKRPGMQYFNALLKLLSECYNFGIVTSLEPPFPLIQSYANAYERLMATLVELGSGYVKIAPGDVMSMPKPRTAQEELGRFAVWETNFRKKNGADVSSYPDDLVGKYEVQDLIGSELIGVSTIEFQSQGSVSVAPPLEGLRWRLDPGPTHLDTVTFQVLSDDKTILQYRGFIDRGARLESRFSRRPIQIRGSVEFQMRDTDVAIMGDGYWKDMLPINYKTGTTKFVMTKISK